MTSMMQLTAFSMLPMAAVQVATPMAAVRRPVMRVHMSDAREPTTSGAGAAKVATTKTEKWTTSVVPPKPTAKYGNGARPRSEWDSKAGYGRYSTMKQAMWSAKLPAKVTLPFSKSEVAVPPFKRPTILDGTHAGDSGFDPLGLAKDTPTLHMYMEAEVKHARLAMLAVLGWVMAELCAEADLASGGRAPSLLNGGLFELQNFLGLCTIFALIANTEKSRDSTTSAALLPNGPGLYDWQHFLDGPFVPGCYNFDPFGLYGILGADAAGRRSVRELEIQHGRVAMVVISIWAFLEPQTKVRALPRRARLSFPHASRARSLTRASSARDRAAAPPDTDRCDQHVCHLLQALLGRDWRRLSQPHRDALNARTLPSAVVRPASPSHMGECAAHKRALLGHPLLGPSRLPSPPIRVLPLSSFRKMGLGGASGAPRGNVPDSCPSRYDHGAWHLRDGFV
jgi:hypothetical protein